MPAVTATVLNGRIRVKSPFEAAEIAKTIPGRLWDKGAKVNHYPATPTTARFVFHTMTDAGFEIGVDRAFLELAARADDAASARAMKTQDDLPEIPGKLKPSWTHQRQAHHFAVAQDGALIAVGMGGGKTKIGIGLLEDRDARRVLIVCPKNVVDVWPKEFAKHAEGEWRVERGRKLKANGLPKKNVSIAERTRTIAAAYAYRDKPLAVVVNYEAAWQGDLGEFLLSVEWDAIVLDESHRIKAPGGAASKFCAKLRDKTSFRLCLTGTPQPHSPLDVYAQARFIDPGVFGTNFAKFRSRYAVMEDRYVGGGRTVATIAKGDDGREIWKNEDELAERIASFSYIIEQDELDRYLKLIEPTDVERYCTLTPKGQKTYDEIWNELAIEIDEGIVTADNVLTRLLRVQQVTSGHLPVDSDGSTDRVVVEVDDAKKKLLADVLEDLPQSKAGFAPVVVFCRFTHDLDNIREIAEESGRAYGELSGRSRSGMTDAATMRDDVDVLGVQMQAGGVGIDLTRAAHAIYYSIGFSLGDYLQSRKRVHRPGQDRHVTYTHLIAQNTIDEIVYATLVKRAEVVDAVIKAAKAK